MTTFEAEVEQIADFRYKGDFVRVTARYEVANNLGSLTVDFPLSAARDFWIGQKLTVTVEPGESR